MENHMSYYDITHWIWSLNIQLFLKVANLLIEDNEYD